MKEVRFHKNVLYYLAELSDILIDKGYFSFYETSAEYIEDIVKFILEKIESVSHKTAPNHFSEFGRNLFYITYPRNKRTTWYILFEKSSGYYLIRYITNNHVSGQYF